jgi:hypothetical protein
MVANCSVRSLVDIRLAPTWVVQSKPYPNQLKPTALQTAMPMMALQIICGGDHGRLLPAISMSSVSGPKFSELFTSKYHGESIGVCAPTYIVPGGQLYSGLK